MTSFSNRLKELRKSTGISQKAMSDYLSITERAYSKYEYGLREPNHETTIKLADYFGVTLDYLLGRNDYCLGADAKEMNNKTDKE